MEFELSEDELAEVELVERELASSKHRRPRLLSCCVRSDGWRPMPTEDSSSKWLQYSLALTFTSLGILFTVLGMAPGPAARMGDIESSDQVQELTTSPSWSSLELPFPLSPRPLSPPSHTSPWAPIGSPTSLFPSPPHALPVYPPPTTPPIGPPPPQPPIQVSALPLPSVGPAYVRSLLNARYMRGAPSNNLEAAGVLVHVLDGGLNGARPWEPGDPLRSYLSCSLLNARKYPHGLYTSNAALVISPRSKLLCGYPQDSGTKAFVRWRGCGPRLCTTQDAPFPKPFRDKGYPCAFPAEMLKECLTVFDNATVDESAYTEMVVSTYDHVIEAVVQAPGKHGNGDAERIHSNLLKHFGLNANQLPLLSFGPGLKGPGPLFYDAWTG